MGEAPRREGASMRTAFQLALNTLHLRIDYYCGAAAVSVLIKRLITEQQGGAGNPRWHRQFP
jgi:hypothetical protein